KKSNKSRFNRLKKLGKLEFRAITNSAELQRVMDDFIACYDFRQGAIYRVLPFREDDQKKKFHIDLFANSASSEICVTATFLDEQPIAAFWGSITGKTVHLGMLIHSPLYAEHSPGKLHIMQLSQYLLEQGKSVLDLTPGGDAWKERFANAHDEVADAVVYRSARKKLIADSREALLTQGKQIAARIGITPAGLRATANKFRQMRPTAAARTLRGWLASTEEFRVYRGDGTRAKSCSMDARLKRNSLNDLMSFEPDGTKTRDAFLSEALMRLERGESVYTICIDNRLAQCSWMTEGGAEISLPQVQQTLRCPPGSVALYDLYLHPQFRNQRLSEAVLGHMLYVVFSNTNVQYVYVPVPVTDTSRQLLESFEFEYLGSFNWKRRVGVVHKSVTSQMLAQLESNTVSA
ncbi:MAG TPA: GNAT family N-acetyltransferase, partial [Steroidobacteraceae bacterium]|nr:GNAT family N-acetyltransferase [Steroidobacteraceae bacterium]